MSHDPESTASLKEQKEAFVSGLTGTTPLELILICSTAPIGIVFYETLEFSWLWSSPSWLKEFVSFWIPMILCETKTQYGFCFLIFQLLIAFVVAAWRRIQRQTSQLSYKDTTEDDMQKCAMTVYRSCLIFLTCIAILAVDFHVFPRRFGKTETIGYSLMDLGAASFVVCAGMVSPRARCTGKFTNTGLPVNFVWSKIIQRMLPVTFIGMLRLLTHKELDYQEHASEYGVHWNFFFTLAVLQPIAIILGGNTPSLLQPALIMSLYQIALTYGGLQNWVEAAPRRCALDSVIGCNFVASNREGLLGCLSYGALYLTSEWIAYQAFWSIKRFEIGTLTAACQSTKRLWLVVGSLLIIWRGLVYLDIEPSRRTTNATFCIWVLFINILQLASIAFAMTCRRRITASIAIPSGFTKTNRHGLLVFVVANLLTGIVNLSINTLQVNDTSALGIITFYLCLVGLVGILVDHMLEYLPGSSVESLMRRTAEASTAVKKNE